MNDATKGLVFSGAAIVVALLSVALAVWSVIHFNRTRRIYTEMVAQRDEQVAGQTIMLNAIDELLDRPAMHPAVKVRAIRQVLDEGAAQ